MGPGELTGVTGQGWARERASVSLGETVVGLAKTVRPWQWYKQAILYLGLIFSLSATDPGAWLQVTAGAAVFCGIAGSVYLFNDVCDVEEDRAHPTKKDRPIASGQVSVPTAIAAGTVLGTASLVSAWWLSPAFFAVLALYVAQNAAYNTVLRDVLFADLLVIGVGFVLRAVGGVVLIGAPVSPWLVLCTFLSAIFLGLGKRTAELGSLEEGVLDEDTRTRESLEGYEGGLVPFLLASVASTLLIAYSLYTFTARSTAMMVTIPFAFYAVFRYAYLVWTENMENPESLFTDRGMVVDLALWGATTVVVLYVPVHWLTLGA